MANVIDTGKAQNRRPLRFHSIDEVLADVERIGDAGRKGTLRHVGNWTPGQVLGHVAAWIEYGYDGYPMKAPPWIIRIILRFLVKKWIKNGMTSGGRIPKTPDGTYGTAALTTEDGVKRSKAAFERLRNEPAKFDSPAFGKMSHEDRVRLTLRHAELHLSFLHY